MVLQAAAAWHWLLASAQLGARSGAVGADEHTVMVMRCYSIGHFQRVDSVEQRQQQSERARSGKQAVQPSALGARRGHPRLWF